MTGTRDMYVSPNRLEGSLAEVSLSRLLDSCRQHLVTGTIRIVSNLASGAVELRGGVVERARFGRLSGPAAVSRMRELRDGSYRVHQGLPDFDGALGSSAHAWGDLSEASLTRVMRHCEEHALTCMITVVNGFDRGEIGYRLGDIIGVRLNGVDDEDAIVEMVGWRHGKFRMSAEPLNAGIEGWPAVAAEPTHPFRMRDRRAQDPGRQRMARGTPTPGNPPRLATNPLDGVNSSTAYFVRPTRRVAVERSKAAGVSEPPPRGKGKRPPSRREETPTMIAELPDEWDLRPPSHEEVFGDGRVAQPIEQSAANVAPADVLEEYIDDAPTPPSVAAVPQAAAPSASGSFSSAPPPRALTHAPSLDRRPAVSSKFVSAMVVFLCVAGISFAVAWAWLQLNE